MPSAGAFTHNVPWSYSVTLVLKPHTWRSRDREPSAAMTKSNGPCRRPQASKRLTPDDSSCACDDVAPGPYLQRLRLRESEESVEEDAAVDAVRVRSRCEVGEARADQFAAGNVAGEELDERRRATEDVLQNAELAEHRLAGTLEQDAGADGARLIGAFDQRDAVTIAGQQVGGRGPRDTAADDADAIHSVSLSNDWNAILTALSVIITQQIFSSNRTQAC